MTKNFKFDRSTNFANLKNKELNEGFDEGFISKDGKKINFLIWDLKISGKICYLKRF